MAKYGKILSNAPVTERVRDDQVKNNAGGYVFQPDDWKRLERFLILGSEGGSYYVSERKLTQENAAVVSRCLATDGKRTVKMIQDISVGGRAAKQDPAIYALAMAISANDLATKEAAQAAFPSIIRTGTHLFQFTEEVQTLRGWGRKLCTTVGNWYINKDGDSLAYQMAKYRNRNGWTHRDVLRMAHPKPLLKEHQALFQWTCKNVATDELPQIVKDLEEIAAHAKEGNRKGIIGVINRNKSITWEMIPTEFLGLAEVWEALLPNMPINAMVRNLGRMTSNGLLKPLSNASKLVCEKLSNAEAIKKSRLHPMQALSALYTYQKGSGIRGSLSWTPVSNIVAATDALFYATFANVEPSNKGFLLALDVSGSMASPQGNCFPGFTPAMGTACMAMVLARREPNHEIVGFADAVRPLGVTSRDTLTAAMHKVILANFGSTDCGAAYKFANANRLDVDCFVVMTDSETWVRGHPHKELEKFRSERGRPNAKAVVVGMVSNGFTIADPKDPNQLDVVGFDTETPALISNFAKD